MMQDFLIIAYIMPFVIMTMIAMVVASDSGWDEYCKFQARAILWPVFLLIGLILGLIRAIDEAFK